MKKMEGKYPRYVSVYDALIEDIKNGVYKPGDTLPGENQLVKRFNVSRNTLRQAIFLLNEDGYVSISQGKETKILKGKSDDKLYLNQLTNPLNTFAINSIDNTTIKIEIRKISPKNQEIFGLDGSNLLLMLQIVYYSNNTAISCALVFVPYMEFKNNNIDLDDEQKIFEMYQTMITSEALQIESNLKLVTPRSPVTSLMQVTEKTRLFMFDELVHDRTGKVVASQKLFMLPNEYDLTFLRRKIR